jgi:FkbM family methyltransferase
MSHLKAGSRVIDVGAHVGLYAMAFGKRVGPQGCVLAAEPDPENLDRLHKHIELNGLKEVVRVVPAGMADAPGTASLSMESLQSHVSSVGGSVQIKLETLDRVTGNERWDLLLIDVEGYEEKVLRGGLGLLGDPARRPGMIMIEVHPYNWPEIGTTSASLLELLRSKGYTVARLDGSPVEEITAYGHIVATIS